MFDFVEETFHQMTLLVEMPIIVSLFLSIPTGRDDGLGLLLGDFGQEISRIVRAVGNYALNVITSDQLFCLSDVMPLPAGQQKPQGIAQRIYVGMDFGTEPAPAAAKGLFSLPAFFWGAPAAHGCARTTVLSSKVFSMSGSSIKC